MHQSLGIDYAYSSLTGLLGLSCFWVSWIVFVSCCILPRYCYHLVVHLSNLSIWCYIQSVFHLLNKNTIFLIIGCVTQNELHFFLTDSLKL